MFSKPAHPWSMKCLAWGGSGEVGWGGRVGKQGRESGWGIWLARWMVKRTDASCHKAQEMPLIR